MCDPDDTTYNNQSPPPYHILDLPNEILTNIVYMLLFLDSQEQNCRRNEWRIPNTHLCVPSKPSLESKTNRSLTSFVDDSWFGFIDARHLISLSSTCKRFHAIIIDLFFKGLDTEQLYVDPYSKRSMTLGVVYKHSPSLL